MTTTTILQLMALQIETLYRVDADGCLVAINEADEPPAALFFMGRTAAGSLWRFHRDLPVGIRAEIDALCRTEPAGADFSQPPRQAEAIKKLVSQYQPVGREWRGPAYAFPEDFAGEGQGILIDGSTEHLFQGEFAEFREFWPLVQPCLALVEQGQAVSVCFSSRTSTAAAEAGVETLPEFRGRGYAGAVVARWARAVRQSGRRPLYSTSWDNLASQAVARKLGLIRYGEDWSLSA
jgi:hypothetical protein